jgi:hypothetical protein
MTRAYTVERRRLANLRLDAQLLSGVRPAPDAAPAADSRAASPGGTVRHLLAVQAQDFAGAKWSVGVRTHGSTDVGIEAALASGEIVRSWPMRGTLHFVAPDDLGWMLSLTSARTIQGAAGRHRQLELTEAELQHAREVALGEMAGGVVLTRDELLARFVAAGIPVDGQRGIHIVQRLALWGVLVFGPPRAGAPGKANQQTFVLVDEWVRSPRTLERDEALGEFALRYFTGHGAATVRDFAWWSSLTLTDARAGLAVARDRLDEVVSDGTSYFLARDAGAAASEAPEAPQTNVLALAGFDEYLLGYQDRRAALSPEHFELIVPGKNGLFLPTIVVDGEVVGTWRRSLTAKGVVVEPQPFAPLTRAEARGFDAAVERYAAFLGRPLLPPA